MSFFGKVKILCCGFAVWGTTVHSEPLELFIDADYSISSAAAESIELGVRTALDEVGYRLGGQDVVVVRKDHRGNVKRSRRTMDQYLESRTALALIGGLHSPPYLTYREFINANEVLTLLPWSAAGPITRGQRDQANWLFRLSVDDMQSGEFLIREAVDNANCDKVALILLETGWGRANLMTLTKALQNRGLEPQTIQFFAASIGNATAETVAENIIRSGAKCGVLLANWFDGATLTNAVFERQSDFRIFSHWGITGGEFANVVSHDVRQGTKLTILQTCGFRREKEGNQILTSALDRAGFPGGNLSNVPAPTGFVHGYDLTRVLIAAANQAATRNEWGGGIKERRLALHQALENLSTPVPGILNTYDPPFRPHGTGDGAAHEALTGEDLCMASFNKDGHLEDAG